MKWKATALLVLYLAVMMGVFFFGRASSGNTRIQAEGIYGPLAGQEEIKGNLTVNSSQVTLQNTSISGNLYLSSPKEAKGEVWLKNVDVTGSLVVMGAAGDLLTRRQGQGSESNLSTGRTHSYTDTSVSPGHTYTYYLVAVSPDGHYSPRLQVQITIPLPPAEMVTLEILINPPQGGSVSGAGTYSAGTVVNLTATPAEGFKFSHWENTDTNSTEPKISIIMTAARTITAVFTEISAEPPPPPPPSGEGNDPDPEP